MNLCPGAAPFEAGRGMVSLCRRVAECMSCVAHALLPAGSLPSAGQQIPSHALYRIGRMMCLASDRRSLASPCMMLVPGPAHVAARGQTAPEDQLRPSAPRCPVAACTSRTASSGLSGQVALPLYSRQIRTDTTRRAHDPLVWRRRLLDHQRQC